MQPLQERQLLQMNRDSLEKRIQQYYNETKNEDVVIEYGLVLLVRNAMVMDDYSFICKDLICKIFLEGKPNNTKRDFCYKAYFADANGKKHMVTFKHADISKSGAELYILFEMLTKLTIFEKDGVRRFTEIMADDCNEVTIHSLIRSKKRAHSR